MVLLPTDEIRLDWVDPATVKMHPDCRVDGERVQAYRRELRETPGGSLPPVLVFNGVALDGNHRLMAYRAEGTPRVLALVVTRLGAETAEDNFRQGWAEAMRGEVCPVETLWEVPTDGEKVVVKQPGISHAR